MGMICRECGQEIQGGIISAKDAVALNKKFLGRKITHFFCVICLAEYLDVSVEDIPEKVEQFKEQGCQLFQ